MSRGRGINVCQRSDINGDGKVGFVDFSILIYFWGSRTKIPTSTSTAGELDRLFDNADLLDGVGARRVRFFHSSADACGFCRILKRIS